MQTLRSLFLRKFMKESINLGNDFFQTSGTLKADAPSYIERSADRELYECVLAGSYAYVLTPRQMGKSSLMTRTAARLRVEGVHVAVLDLTGIGGDARSMTADEWYFGLANKMLRELVISFPLTAWWKDQILLPPLNRLMNFFQDVVLKQLEGNIVVFVDEIDTTIKLPFSDDFFASIRFCFNERANQDIFDRVCFVLLGVASPADLIRDPTRTPFNIGQRIDLTDFDVIEAKHFICGFHEDSGIAERLLQRILYWTGGHPYLTQKVCVLTQIGAVNETPETRVDRVVKAEFLGVGQRTKEDNLKLINNRIAEAEEYHSELLKIYAKVRKGKRVQDQPQSPIHSTIKLSGLVKTDQLGRLKVRNEIYKQVFDARWINQLTPSHWPQRLAVASVVIPAAVFSWWIGSQQLTVTSIKGIILAGLSIAYPEPEMVEIPSGRFLMGSLKNEAGHIKHEGPQHTVTFNQAFYLGKYEVTFNEYDVFATVTGRTKPNDEGWGRGDRPVINVSWDDALAYTKWLSENTNMHYRLPSEAEWEYAARATTKKPRYWSEKPPNEPDAACSYANVFDTKNKAVIKARYSYIDWDAFKCGDEFPFTAPVGKFLANQWGLHDMLGNVWEWTEDCFVDDYKATPRDGSAQESADGKACPLRVLRGGSWINVPLYERSAYRNGFTSDNRRNIIGFRLARTP